MYLVRHLCILLPETSTCLSESVLLSLFYTTEIKSCIKSDEHFLKVILFILKTQPLPSQQNNRKKHILEEKVCYLLLAILREDIIKGVLLQTKQSCRYNRSPLYVVEQI
jgi:hypothetical protein